MKIFVTGARGYLASFLIPKLLKNHSVILTSNHTDKPISNNPIIALNLVKKNEIEQVLQQNPPDFIINTAAISLPDWAEDHPQETYEANVVAVQNLVEICKDRSIPLLHMSTDYVFSGENPPYSEYSERNPVNLYGRSKLDAEKVIEQSTIEYLICRTTLLYGLKESHHRPNPFTDWYDKLKNHIRFDAPMNHYTSPTYAADLADCLINLIEHKYRGIYHTAGCESVSRYQFACQIAEVFGFDSSVITPVPLVNKRAIRPKNTSLSVLKLREETGLVLTPPREGFKVIKSILDKSAIK